MTGNAHQEEAIIQKIGCPPPPVVLMQTQIFQINVEAVSVTSADRFKSIFYSLILKF